MECAGWLGVILMAFPRRVKCHAKQSPTAHRMFRADLIKRSRTNVPPVRDQCDLEMLRSKTRVASCGVARVCFRALFPFARRRLDAGEYRAIERMRMRMRIIESGKGGDHGAVDQNAKFTERQRAKREIRDDTSLLSEQVVLVFRIRGAFLGPPF
ncbi:uncharacterized protein J3R85_018799 [Psidium guajava]|nr:uncharacterized protein J3R85_018799 [Psidium guajava]